MIKILDRNISYFSGRIVALEEMSKPSEQPPVEVNQSEEDVFKLKGNPRLSYFYYFYFARIVVSPGKTTRTNYVSIEWSQPWLHAGINDICSIQFEWSQLQTEFAETTDSLERARSKCIELQVDLSRERRATKDLEMRLWVMMLYFDCHILLYFSNLTDVQSLNIRWLHRPFQSSSHSPTDFSNQTELSRILRKMEGSRNSWCPHMNS